MSFKINNVSAQTARSVMTYDDDVVTFPGLVYGDAAVVTPLENFYCERMQLTLNEDTNRNITLACDDEGLVCDIKGNLRITWTLNVTVPDASSQNHKYFGPKITRDECGDRSYCYNIFKVRSPEPQTFEFTNNIQNSTGDLKLYFGMFSPTGCQTDYIINHSTINVIGINSLKSDGGRDRN